MRIIKLFVLVLLLTKNPLHAASAIVTAVDRSGFAAVCNLIGSVHSVYGKQCPRIVIGDTGLTLQQVKELYRYFGVMVVKIPHTHRAPRLACIKKALEFNEAALWLEPTTVIQKSLAPLFENIRQTGYFLTTYDDSSTKTVQELLSAEVIARYDLSNPYKKWLLSFDPVGPKLFGFTQEGMKKLPLFSSDNELSDEQLLSLYAYLTGLFVHTYHKRQTLPLFVAVNDAQIPITVSHHQSGSPDLIFSYSGSSFTNNILLRVISKGG